MSQSFILSSFYVTKFYFEQPKTLVEMGTSNSYTMLASEGLLVKRRRERRYVIDTFMMVGIKFFTKMTRHQDKYSMDL